MCDITESQFYMWRTLFALVHADHTVTPEEVRFMAEALEDLAFSDVQYAQLIEDTKHPQDIEAMFLNIEDVRDQAEFFRLGHALVHIDGDYGAEEQAVMLRLKEIHLQRPDLDDLIGDVDLKLENAEQEAERLEGRSAFQHAIWSFRKRFLKDRFG